MSQIASWKWVVMIFLILAVIAVIQDVLAWWARSFALILLEAIQMVVALVGLVVVKCLPSKQPSRQGEQATVQGLRHGDR